MTQSADRLTSPPKRNGKSALAALASNHYSPFSLPVGGGVYRAVANREREKRLSPVILPSPGNVAAAFVELTASGELIRATRPSLSGRLPFG